MCICIQFCCYKSQPLTEITKIKTANCFLASVKALPFKLPRFNCGREALPLHWKHTRQTRPGGQ